MSLAVKVSCKSRKKKNENGRQNCMSVCSNDAKQNKEISIMDTVKVNRRLKSFRAVTDLRSGSKRDLKRPTLEVSQEFAVLQANNTVDLNCIVFSLPRDLPHEKKMKRLSTFAGKVADITGSDVICMAMWLPY